MTNQEKYKTAQERATAFWQFCQTRVCAKCPLRDISKTSNSCIFNWLEVEAKEKLLPCPFCGGKASASDSGVSVAAYVRCDNCHSSSGDYDTKEEAIAAWNRRANNG